MFIKSYAVPHSSCATHYKNYQNVLEQPKFSIDYRHFNLVKKLYIYTYILHNIV